MIEDNSKKKYRKGTKCDIKYFYILCNKVIYFQLVYMQYSIIINDIKIQDDYDFCFLIICNRIEQLMTKIIEEKNDGLDTWYINQVTLVFIDNMKWLMLVLLFTYYCYGNILK